MFKAATGSAALSGAGCGTLTISGGGTGATVTTTTATVTTTGSSTGACSLNLSGLQVQPSAGKPLASGNIVASGLASGNAGALTEVAGAPVLTFTQQPSASAAGGVVFAQQPKVKSADQAGNARVGDLVTLAINTASAAGVLTCAPTTNQATTVNVAGEAIATFAGCSIDKAGTYTLRATTAGQAGTIPVSSTVTITVGAAAKLVFYQRPNAAVAGVNFPLQPIVAVADTAGNILPSDIARTISITASPAGGLTCSTGPSNVSTAVTAIGVAATFAGCRITSAGVGYTLTATSSPSLTSATTAAFDVENAIVFSQQPSGAIGGAVFTTQPIVALRANGSNAVNDSTTLVTLSIRSGTGVSGAILTCSGGLSKTVTAGVANFTGCSIDRLSPSGNPYQLVASTTTGLGSANSSTFAVTAGPASSSRSPPSRSTPMSGRRSRPHRW